ncbi:MAG: 2-hydroxyacid dehydrogenase [Thiolinea sp.]
MAEKPLIVYPDADGDEEVLYKEQFAHLRNIANLKIYTGQPGSHEEYIERIAGAQGLLLGWGLPAEVMQQADKLEVISFTGVGADKFIDTNQAAAQNIVVCNCPGYSDITVAEHTMALLLSVCRHIPKYDHEMRNGSWQPDKPAIELHGKCIGLVGFGGIGRQFSQLCKAFGMRVLVWTRSMNPELEKQYGVELCALETIYQHCDVISLHLASNVQTAGLIDQTAFDTMRTGTILINTARAELVNENALIQALQTGKLSAAALDVFHDEPLPSEHPLTEMKNVVLTPHIGYNTPEAVSRLFEIATDNLISYFRGEVQNQIG